MSEVDLLHSTAEPLAELSGVTLQPSREPVGVLLPKAVGSRLDITVNFTLPDHAADAQPFGLGGGSVGFAVMCDADVTIPTAEVRERKQRRHRILLSPHFPVWMIE
eukprot:COSAG06_NODE_5382_length_3512_cov_6.128040_4_plen_106_part_00